MHLGKFHFQIYQFSQLFSSSYFFCPKRPFPYFPATNWTQSHSALAASANTPIQNIQTFEILEKSSIMKSIAIIGASVGGCTTYLFLKSTSRPTSPTPKSIFTNPTHRHPTFQSPTPKQPPQGASIDERPNLKSDPTTNVTTALGGGLGLSTNGIRVFKAPDPEIYGRIKASSIELEAFRAQISSGRMMGNFKAGGKRYGHGTFMVMRAALHD
jgi:hypothetical protein